MNEIELSRLYFLNRERVRLTEQLYELEQMAKFREGGSAKKSRNTRISDPTADFACEITEMKRLIRVNLKKLLKERLKIEHFLSKIEDAEIRLICRLRHSIGMSWEAIGEEIGYTESGVRKKYSRFIGGIS